MKKYISLIFIGLFLAVGARAQNPETLNNSSVIKMSKARLSDELIIDMIMNSPASFSLGSGGEGMLRSEGVSEAVIEAMKARSEGNRSGEPLSTSATDQQREASVSLRAVNEDEPAQYVAAEVIETISVTALNYVKPLSSLIKFCEDEFRTYETALAEWDKKVRTLTADVNRVKDQMLETENNLRMLKNADTKIFSAEILSLKKKLDLYRKNYSKSKDIMLTGGQNMLKWVDSEMGNRARDLGKAYSTAGQLISSSDNEPASGEQPSSVTFTTREVSESTSSYLVFATEMLVWYQNEIENLNSLIGEWNPRVTRVISDDERLITRIRPLEDRLEELKADTRLNKNEISGIKKQVSDLEKERKGLAATMRNDAKELSSVIKQQSQVNQESLKQRFADIIENITYAFEEKLSL